ncbi:MAG: hypothetical protein ACYTFQ_29495, partial [Planctomycetota bacterium]
MDTLREKMRRREFLASGAMAAVGTAVVTAANDSAKPAAASAGSGPKPPKFILDSHIHCGGTEAWVEEMVAIYR